MDKFPPHPAALLMPRPDEDEYKQLEADILANGLIDPIELYNGMVIDGVTRQDICLKHGLEMSSNYLPIDEHSLGPHRCPYRYVLSKNTRRSLTAGQLAMVAAGLKEAKSGSLKAIKNGKIPTSAAAAAVGVDRKLVKEAEIVRAKGSETVIKAVEEKGMSVSVAKKLVEVTPNKEEQDRVVQAGKEEVKRRISGGTTFDVKEIEGAEAEPDVTARMKEWNREVESFARSIVALAKSAPSGGWWDDSQANITSQQLKAAAGSARQAKCDNVCPVCEGKGCARCKQTGFMPKRTYEMAGGK